MTVTSPHSTQVIVITDHGGQKRNDRWSHVHVQAQLTDATPEQVDGVRQLIGQIVEIMRR